MLTTLFQWISQILSRLSGKKSQGQSHSSSDSSQDSQDKKEPVKLPINPPLSGKLSEGDLIRLEKLHRMEEGVKSVVYRDSLGYLTIGIGHLIDPRRGGFLPPYAQLELDTKGYISDTTITKLYREDLSKVLEDLETHLPWCFNLDSTRRDVLIDMCFQMGIGSKTSGKGLLGFTNSLRLIKEGDFKRAGENLKQSAWFRQTPNRAKRRIEEIVTGTPYPYK